MPLTYLEELEERVERDVMACIGCNDCLLTCPLPEARLVTIAELNHAVHDDVITDPEVREFVMKCTQCQQCVPVCPADLRRADIVLWNKMKAESAEPDRPMPLQVGTRIEQSGWTLDALAGHLVQLPLFRGVEAEHLRRMLLQSTLRRLSAGDVLTEEGEFYERLYVVLDGKLEQSATADHAGGELDRILVLGPGSFHGELGVLGNRRDPFTVKAASDVFVLEMPKATVHRLMQESEPFRTTLDGSYSRRALWTQAKSSPILAALPEDVVDELLKQAAFHILPRGEVVYREGDAATDLFMVRSGFLRVARRFGDRDRVLQYFREGDVFGANALLFNRPQSATVSANTRAEIIAVPGRALTRLLDADPALRTRLTSEAQASERLPELNERGRPTGRATEQMLPLEGLVDDGIVQGKHVLMIDTSICMNCNNCVEACERRHGYARLERNGMQLGSMLFPTACRHCEDPVCLMCSVNGIVREPDGEIRIVQDNCIGCGACASRCPYDNIQLHKRNEEDHSFRDMFRVVPRQKFELPDPDFFHHDTKDRVAVKCDLCAGYDYYACVHACPVGAAMRVDPVEAFGRNDVVIGLEMHKGSPTDK